MDFEKHLGKSTIRTIVLFIKNLAKILGLVWNTNPRYLGIFGVITLIHGFYPPLQLWLTKLLIDSSSDFIQNNSSSFFKTFLFYVVLYLLGILFGSLLGIGSNTLRILLGEQVNNWININILDKSNKLDVTYFEDDKFYNMLQNAFREAGQRPIQIVSQLYELIRSLITLIATLYILLKLHWSIAPIIIMTSVPILVIQNRFGLETYWMHRNRTPDLRKLQYFGMLLTSDINIKEIRVFQLDAYFMNIYKNIFSNFLKENRSLTIKKSIGSTLGVLFILIGVIYAVVYLSLQMLNRLVSIGDFVLYLQSISMGQNLLQSIFITMSSIYSDTLYINNLFEFLALPIPHTPGSKCWNEPIKDIEFRHVKFMYPGTQAIVLDDINFYVKAGHSIALIGKNGAGKTTIAKLLCGLYKPTEGEILFNGENISNYCQQSIQKYVSILFQDFGSYYISAIENIRIGRVTESLDFERIRDVTQKSGASKIIDSLPMGYNTILGRWFKDGVQLSGGEWQKIALSRIFYRRGQLLVLDEPSAFLDAEAEGNVFDCVLREKRELITVLISHRLSTTRLADEILVLEEGKCIEKGSHEDLLRKEGVYSHLFTIQAKGYKGTE